MVQCLQCLTNAALGTIFRFALKCLLLRALVLDCGLHNNLGTDEK